MKEITDLKPKDLIAIIVILCVVFLIYTGYDGPLTEVFTLVIGYYFGLRKPQQENGL
jgi:hypothetical protein